MTKKELGILIFIVVFMALVLVGFALFFYKYRQNAKKNINEGQYDSDILKQFQEDSNPEAKKRAKRSYIVKKVLYILSIVVISVLLVFAFVNKMGWLSVGNRSIIVVASGSMSQKHPSNDYLVTEGLDDQFPTFSIIVIEKVDPDELQKYDTIVYKNNHNENIIHRIIRIEKSASQTLFVTQGDANNVEDDYKSKPEDIQGRYTGQYVPYIGAIVLFLQSSLGITTMLALIIGLVLIDSTKNAVNQYQDNRLKLLLNKLGLDENNIFSFSEADLSNLALSLNQTQLNEDSDKSADQTHIPSQTEDNQTETMPDNNDASSQNDNGNN